jgi:hypothetical protein
MMNSKAMTLTTGLLLASAILLLGGAALAQLPPLPPAPGEAIATFASPGMPMQMKVSTMGLRVDNMDASPVKGNPFCGTITSEHTQAFADGNRIHTTENSTLCRDSQGRIRREAEINLLGASQQKDLPKIVTIVDPVAGVRYMLDSNMKIARKMPLEPFALPAEPEAGVRTSGRMAVVVKGDAVNATGGPGSVMYYSTTTMAKNAGPAQNPPNVENLGDQTINGIHATGTRVTTTIPAGSMGNEQAILVQSETWSSPELKATVMTKHTDPWAGELKTQLTNVSNSEPNPSMFTVPSDYKIVDEKPFQIKLPPPPPAQE